MKAFKFNKSFVRSVITGIPKLEVGLIGMIAAVGHIVNVPFDIVDYLLHKRGSSLKTVQCITMLILVINTSGTVCVCLSVIDLTYTQIYVPVKYYTTFS